MGRGASAVRGWSPVEATGVGRQGEDERECVFSTRHCAQRRSRTLKHVASPPVERVHWTWRNYPCPMPYALCPMPHA
ncbi:MAG: hypothetical protein KME31_22970 [Tolypothrix carrinoi HA7290-LM1]|nr:hypothetical protein [Tolypothrix carrinoi HA7290-LM1]